MRPRVYHCIGLLSKGFADDDRFSTSWICSKLCLADGASRSAARPPLVWTQLARQTAKRYPILQISTWVRDRCLRVSHKAPRCIQSILLRWPTRDQGRTNVSTVHLRHCPSRPDHPGKQSQQLRPSTNPESPYAHSTQPQ